MLIEVNEHYIRMGSHTADSCPVALAICDVLENYEVSVSQGQTTLIDTNLQLRHISHPVLLWEWISAYDSPNTEENQVKPISFNLDLDLNLIYNVKDI